MSRIYEWKLLQQATLARTVVFDSILIVTSPTQTLLVINTLQSTLQLGQETHLNN